MQGAGDTALMATHVLVTGGSGYFGEVLVRHLCKLGHSVRVLDLADSPTRPAAAAFIQGDVRDPSAVERACAGIDTVYHCVAQVPLVRDRRLFWSVNVVGTERLLEAAVEAGVSKALLLSSSAVFGVPERNPVTELTPPLPLEDYGRAKLAGEEIAKRLHATRGLDVTIIRPRTILGHGRLGIFELLFSWIADGKNVYVLGSGNNLYQFVHAGDLAAGCVAAAGRPGFQSYNLGARRFGTIRESLEGLVDHAGTGSRVRSLPVAPATAAMSWLARAGLVPFAPYHWLLYGRELYFDLTKAEREIGWAPRWGNVEMLCQSYDWYLSHRADVAVSMAGSPHRRAVPRGVLRLLRWLS